MTIRDLIILSGLKPGLVLSCTGHRPHKLGGYAPRNPYKLVIQQHMREVLQELRPREVISGMALGIDQWLAEVCIELRVPFIAAVPCRGQESTWPREAQEHYRWLLSKAARVEVCWQGAYTPRAMHARNEWMVDNSNVLLAYFDGTAGGTKACCDYAKGKGRVTLRFNPRDFNVDTRPLSKTDQAVEDELDRLLEDL